MIRVVIADDHTIVREGLKQLLLAAGDLDVVGEARDGHEVLQHVRADDFDVLLLDMSMPGKSGMELIKQVKTEKPVSEHEKAQKAFHENRERLKALRLAREAAEKARRT